MHVGALTDALKEKATSLGFALAGACPAVAPAGAGRLEEWLSRGYAGQMNYLAERREAYSHPRHLLEGVRSVLMLGMPYRTAAPVTASAGEGRVARYAWGSIDYHDLIRERLHQLADYLRELAPKATTRGVVDTAPLLEREFAQLAGLGWVGKNTLLLNRQAGSYFFLAALLTDQALQYDAPHEADHCGSCTACLDACPTSAFPQAYVLDASRCISYLTIELREAMPAELRGGVGDWIFGCDVCQEVCPWNRFAPLSREAGFEPLASMNPVALGELFSLSEQDFRRRFRRTPLWRPHRRGLLRNAAIVLGNQRDEAAVESLGCGLHDDEPVVRGACAWALGQIGTVAASKLLAGRAEIETAPDVREEIRAALDAVDERSHASRMDDSGIRWTPSPIASQELPPCARATSGRPCSVAPIPTRGRGPEEPVIVAQTRNQPLNELRLGNVVLDFPVVQAALSGYSDTAMRVIARRLGAPYALCEVMLDYFIVQVKDRPRNSHLMHVANEEHPAGGQLMGAEPEKFGPAAKRLVERGFDVIDINFGCPVKKVLGRCRGGFHLSQPAVALEIVSRVREAVPAYIPVTVKMRRGIDDTAQSREQFFEIFDGAYERGASAITVHGRTVMQRYDGPSRWDFLRELKAYAGERVVLGSGDLFSAQACLDMMHYTGVDGVTVARGAIGNPWVFQHARALAAGLPMPDPPTLHEQRDVIGEHYRLAEELYGAERCVPTMRKFGIKYSQLHPQHREVREDFAKVKQAGGWRDVLAMWYAVDGPGVHPHVEEPNPLATVG